MVALPETVRVGFNYDDSLTRPPRLEGRGGERHGRGPSEPVGRVLLMAGQRTRNQASRPCNFGACVGLARPDAVDQVPNATWATSVAHWIKL
eukprot:4509394-Pyramimonas_sp.AAC.1